jgi:gluconolactonase
MDPAIDKLIAPDAVVEKIGGGYVFTEGPMWRGGRLWFSDEEGDRTHALTAAGSDQLLLDYRKIPMPMGPDGRIGPNGMAADKDGGVVMALQYGRAVVRLVGEAGSLKVVPLFDSYEGKHLNSPNDLVFLPDGSFFFTDPPFGLKLHDADPAKQLPFDGVFYVKDGRLTPIITDLKLPNGIALSPDNRTLYINNSGPDQRLIAYDLHADGSVGPGRNIITFTGREGDGVPDGMKVDALGDLWATGPGGVRIITPQGKVLGQIKLPEVAANVAWGGEDGRTLYITARTGVYALPTLVQGKMPAFGR